MKILKKQILPMLLIFSMLLLSACAKTENNGKDKNDSNGSDSNPLQAKGRYLEEEITLSEQTGDIFAIKRLEDGTLRLAAFLGIFDSNDDGTTWTKTGIGAELRTEEYSISSADIDSKGNIIMLVYRIGENPEDYTTEYHYLDKDGNDKILDIKLDPYDFGEMETGEMNTEADEETSEESDEEAPEGTIEGGLDSSFSTNMENAIHEIKFSESGDVIGLDYNSTILQIDPASGEIKNTLKNEDYVDSLTLSGDKLMIQTMDHAVEVYNLETLQLEDSYPALNDFYAAQAQEQSGNISFGLPAKLMKAGLKADTLLYVDQSGLYQYTLGGTVVEQIINGTTNTMGNLELGISALEQLDENTYLAAFRGNQKEEYKLMKYTYSGEAAITPTNEINVYALNDNQALRQAISTYQQNNPDTLVNLEIGMSQGQTLSDTLRTLNTNIMSGKGPDILVLDGIPVNNYIEKNLLEDITDLVEEVDKSDGLYGDITKAYEKDEKIYAVPSKFSIPVISGAGESVDSVENAGTLAEQLESAAATGEPLLANGYTAKSYLRSTLCYAYNMVKEDGTLDEDILKSYLKDSNRGYVADIQDVQQEVLDDYKEMYDQNDAVNNGMELGMGLLTKKQILDIGNLSTMESYATLNAINKNMETVSKNISVDDKQLFTPDLVLGINSKSGQMDVAKDFVKAMLSEEIQSTRIGEGLPVNKKAFDKICTPPTEDKEDYMMSIVISDETGGMKTLDITWPTDEEITKLKDIVQNLNTPLNFDSTIQESVLEEGSKCLNGEITADEAAANILKTVQLYLSE